MWTKLSTGETAKLAPEEQQELSNLLFFFDTSLTYTGETFEGVTDEEVEQVINYVKEQNAKPGVRPLLVYDFLQDLSRDKVNAKPGVQYPTRAERAKRGTGSSAYVESVRKAR